MKLFIFMIFTLGFFSTFGQQNVLGKWKFECVVIDRDTIFLRSDSTMMFKTGEKRELRDTLGRKIFNLKEKSIDTAHVFSAYRAHAAAYIAFKQKNKSEWYIPVRPSEKNEKPGIIYYKIAGKFALFYEDAAMQKTPKRLNMIQTGNSLILESTEGVKTIFVLSRS